MWVSQYPNVMGKLVVVVHSDALVRSWTRAMSVTITCVTNTLPNTAKPPYTQHLPDCATKDMFTLVQAQESNVANKHGIFEIELGGMPQHITQDLYT